MGKDNLALMSKRSAADVEGDVRVHPGGKQAPEMADRRPCLRAAPAPAQAPRRRKDLARPAALHHRYLGLAILSLSLAKIRLWIAMFRLFVARFAWLGWRRTPLPSCPFI